MAEPTLSELYNYTPRPELATGDRDVVPDNRAAIEDAIGLAQENNKAIQQRYALYQKAYADRLKSGQVDYTGVNPNHIPALKEKAARVYSILYKNPSALAGINIDPKTEAEFNEAKNDLDLSVAASKKQYDYAQHQDEILKQTPELRTDKNNAQAKYNYEAPLGSFQPKSFELPTVIDYNALAKGALDVSKKEKSIFEPEYVPRRNAAGALIPKVVDGQVQVDANGQPIYEQDYAGRFKSGIVKEADYDSYMKNALSTYDSNQPLGKYSQPIQQSVATTYRGLPEDQKIAIEENAKASNMSPQRYFYMKTMASKFDKMTDLSGVKEVEDNLYKQNQDLRNDLQKMKVKYGYDWNLAKLKLENEKDLELWKEKNGLRDIDKGGEALNDIVAGAVGQALSKGASNSMVIVKADGTKENGWHKMDVPRTTLEFFSSDVPVLDKKGRPALTSAGKPILEKSSPVEMWVNDDGTKVRPIFGTEKSSTGSRAITNNDFSQPITIDQFKQGVAVGLGLEKSLDASNRMLTRIPGFSFPTLNGKVQEYIQNRSAGNYNPDKGGGGKSTVSKTQTGGGSRMNAKFPGEPFTFKGKTYSAEEVANKAKASGMSVEEYKKALTGQ